MSITGADVAVVGAGIVGLAHALAAARQGRRVVVFERDARALGASVRNFGLVWPVGQRRDLYQTALRSRDVWLQLASDAGFWANPGGSLLVARRPEELAVLHEFIEASPAARERGCRVLGPAKALQRSSGVRGDGLLGGLWSPTEVTVDPREAIPAIAGHLHRRYGVRFEFGTTVTAIEMPTVQTTRGRWSADEVLVCSGAAWDTLYRAEHEDAGLRRCTLQMLRTVEQPNRWRLGPALCSGLSLLHYEAFRGLPSLGALRDRLEAELPHHRRDGVHALVSQTEGGALSIGDSHSYGAVADPFLCESVYNSILDYLGSFANIPEAHVAERWVGVYASGRGDQFPTRFSPAPGVTVVNGLGGSGMTLSFALAEHVFPGRAS